LYERFYNLKENPFRLNPDPAFVCMTEQHREALSGLVHSACARSGLTVLLGEAGTGKTTLLYTLAALLEKRRFVAAMCTNPILTRAEFYDFLMLAFDVECPSNLKSRQLEALEQTLLKNRADGRPSLLIVDEGQRLSPELLEELRLLLNLETPREKLLDIMIAGQPELGEILQSSGLRQFKQRVSCLCKLKPLTPEELEEYIQHRLKKAGHPEQTLFPPDIIDSIFGYTHGLPRLVNSLCDTALQIGFAFQAKVITHEILDESALDLELKRMAAMKNGNGAHSHAAAAVMPDAALQVRAPLAAAAATALAPEESWEGTQTDQPVSMPMESYGKRQNSLGFIANLMQRLK
jgi:general secretion pathway protein A